MSHFGGGAVYFYLQPVKAFLNDKNNQLIHFYTDFIKEYDRSKNEIDELSKKYKSMSQMEQKKLYYDVRNKFNCNDETLTFATKYYILNKLSWQCRFRTNSKGNMNSPFGYRKTLTTKSIDQEHYNLLKTATITNSDYIDSFNKAKTVDFMFLDPPYGTIFNDYTTKDYFTEDNQRKLAEDFKNLSCKALMIISKDKLITELYHGYIKEEYQKRYSFMQSSRVSSPQNTHLIITNYSH